MVGALPRPLVPPDFRLSRVWGHTGRTLRAEGGHPAGLDPSGGLPQPPKPLWGRLVQGICAFCCLLLGPICTLNNSNIKSEKFINESS